MRSLIGVLLLASAALAQLQPVLNIASSITGSLDLGGLLGGGEGFLGGLLGGGGGGGLFEGLLGGDGLVGGLVSGLLGPLLGDGGGGLLGGLPGGGGGGGLLGGGVSGAVGQVGDLVTCILGQLLGQVGSLLDQILGLVPGAVGPGGNPSTSNNPCNPSSLADDILADDATVNTVIECVTSDQLSVQEVGQLIANDILSANDVAQLITSGVFPLSAVATLIRNGDLSFADVAEIIIYGAISLGDINQWLDDGTLSVNDLGQIIANDGLSVEEVLDLYDSDFIVALDLVHFIIDGIFEFGEINYLRNKALSLDLIGTFLRDGEMTNSDFAELLNQNMFIGNDIAKLIRDGVLKIPDLVEIYALTDSEMSGKFESLVYLGALSLEALQRIKREAAALAS